MSRQEGKKRVRFTKEEDSLLFSIFIQCSYNINQAAKIFYQSSENVINVGSGVFEKHSLSTIKCHIKDCIMLQAPIETHEFELLNHLKKELGNNYTQISMIYFKKTGIYHSATSLNNYFTRLSRKIEIPEIKQLTGIEDSQDKTYTSRSVGILSIESLLN